MAVGPGSLTTGRIRLLAGSLGGGTVRACQFVPASQGRPGPLGRAFIQIGRMIRSSASTTRAPGSTANEKREATV